jgi:hypothetical protein
MTYKVTNYLQQFYWTLHMPQVLHFQLKSQTLCGMVSGILHAMAQIAIVHFQLTLSLPKYFEKWSLAGPKK